MNPGLIKTFEAGAAIGANRIVTLNAAGKVVAAADNQAVPIGVVQHACSAGDRVDVQMSGIVDVALGGTVTPGSTVSAGAQGVATASDPGCLVAGVALESGNTGEVVPVMFAMHCGPAEPPATSYHWATNANTTEYHICKVDNTGKFVDASAASDKLVGVAMQTTTTGGQIAVAGTICIWAGGSITAGDYVTATDGGAAVVANPATDNYVGIAINSATADSYVDVILMPNHVRPSATTDGDDDDDDSSPAT